MTINCIMRFDIITIFPNFFDSFLSESLIAKAQKKKIIDIRVHNLRDWAKDKHHTVDDRPYGGGPGMILKFEPICRALKALRVLSSTSFRQYSLSEFARWRRSRRVSVIMLDPAGKQFDQRMAEKFSKLDRVVLLCGRYEGFDHRVTTLVDERVSIGSYVLNGGEVPAMVIMEAVSRLIPGFVHKPESLNEETRGKEYIEYPQYTRPEMILWNKKKLVVPEILLSGDHKKIKEWQKKHVK